MALSEVEGMWAHPEAPVRAPSWPSKKSQTFGPIGHSGVRLSHLGEHLSAGSLSMPVLQGTSRSMSKQRKELGLPHRPTLLQQDMPGLTGL